MKARNLAVFDIDGTFFRWQLYHELIFTLKDKGVFSAETSKELEQALFDWKALKATWGDYENKVVKTAENELYTLNSEQLKDIAQETVQEHGHRVYNYTLRLSQKLKKQGYFLLAISGSFQEIAEIFAKKYGFDDCIGMIPKKDEHGNFTKGYERPIYGHKAKVLKNYLEEHPTLTLTDSYGVGDSSGDIDILQIVGNPIAFNPTAELLEAAKQNAWPIIIERKNIAFRLSPKDGAYILEDYELY